MNGAALPSLAWMAWTWQTSLFFAAIALLVGSLTLLELRFPTQRRKGFLPIATTRGDRIFICLLLAALLHALWIALSEQPLWVASSAAAAVSALVLAKG